MKPAVYTSPELEELRQLVASARARLAELEADYTKEKSRVDVVQAALFRLLREQYQRRDRLRITIDYRRKLLDALIRGDEKESKEAEETYKQAKAQTDKDYEELATAADKKKNLTADQEAELTQLWKKLVKLYHPDRFSDHPDKLETYHKLTAAINQAKDNGDIETLREIAEDPHSFLMRKGWMKLDFGDTQELTQLRRLHEALQTEITRIAESLEKLRESPDYELCQLSEQKPGLLDELAAERKLQVESEIAELEKQAEELANQIKKLRVNPNTKETGATVASPKHAEASSASRGVEKVSTILAQSLGKTKSVHNSQRFSHMRSVNFGSIIAKLIAAVMLFDALDRHSYDYYTLLRWVACGVCAFTAFQAMQSKKVGWLWIFAFAAIMLNPVAPLHLKRWDWAIVDSCAALLLLLSIVILDIRKPPP